MAISIKDFRMAIRIDNAEAKQKLEETKQQLAGVTAEMDKLAGEGKKNSAEYKALKKRQDELNTSLYRQRLEAGRTALTYNELRQGASQLRRELNRTKPGTAEWKRLQADLKLTTERMKELRGTATETGLSIGKVADGFNRYMGLAAGAVATLTGMTLTMRQSVDEYAKMEEAESQVIKYTGMTREEVKQLNEEFKAMDTRTPREELNRLAGEAGKLGITGVQQVLEFVQAADMINVALGEDLGEEAVNQIGKLSQMFGDESRSLKENMLAIGSTVNQVAQSTSASEPYLVAFAARMGGVGKQAQMSVTDIMGFASALDQNMLRSEMASTALSGLIMRIYQEPAKYAKLAGMDVEQFTRLVETDVNEAVMSFLSALNKMGGMAEVAPILKEMQLSGAEAASVISTLAGNVDLVRREQENANKAFREGTSIGNEFNVQNNTVQAGLEKARKQFQEVRVELGQRLQPVMKNMISFGSLTVKGVLELIRIYNEYKGIILTTGAALGVYTVAVNASVIADKAKVLWSGRVVTSLKTLFTLLKTNPWGIAVTAVGAVIGLLIDLKRRQDSVTESMQAMERINQSASKQYDEQASRIEMLNDLLHDETQAHNRRAEALEELKGIIPGYNGMLTDEGKLIGDNTEAIKDYLVELEKQIKLKAAQEELEELYRRKRQSEKQLVTDEANLDTARRNLNIAETTASMRASQAGTTGTRNLMTGLNQGVKTMRTEFEKADQAVRKTKEELTGIEQAIADVNREILSSSSKADLGDDPVTSGQTPTPTEEQPEPVDTSAFNARKALLEQQYREEVNLLKQKYLDEQLTQEEYNRQIYAAESAHLEAMKALMEQYGQDTTGLQGQIYDRMIDEANRRYQEQQALETEIMQQAEADMNAANKQMDDYRKGEREKGLADIDATTDYGLQLDMLKAMYDADLINYEEYQQMKDKLAEQHEQQRQDTAQKALGMVSQAAGAASQLVQTLQDRELQKVEDSYDRRIDAAQKAGKDTTKLEEEKEAALEEVRKKYADKQFAANVLQIASDTAAAIMRSYAQLGPILGPIYAAIVAAQGAIQIAAAKQQRDEAMGLKEGGFSKDYVEGYTRRGNPDDTAGVIPIHKNEFVANHEAVANPAVRQFLDVFDLAQKRGTIRMLNTTQILEQVRTRSGKYSGGYTAENSGTSRPSASPLSGMSPEQRSQVVNLLIENNRLLGILCDKELVVDPRKVRDGIRRVERLEQNVSRK